MNTFKLSTLVFALVFGALLGCGGSTTNGAGGSTGAGGAIGTGGMADGAMGGGEAGQGGQGGSSGVLPACGASGYVDCTGLTPAQCHDLIINPPAAVIPNCVVAQDPSGAPPPVAYPYCGAI